MNPHIRQTLIVGKIEHGVVSPSPAVAAYIEARRANLRQHDPAALKRAWDAMTQAEQDAMTRCCWRRCDDDH